MTHQTQLRTIDPTPNDNISFPIGTILTVQDYYNHLKLFETFGKHKSKGISINSLIQALLSYKLTENQSVARAAEWINRDEVLDVFHLELFEQRTLYRVLEIIGENCEEIIADIQDTLFDLYEFEHTDINLDWTSFILWGIMSQAIFFAGNRNSKNQFCKSIIFPSISISKANPQCRLTARGYAKLPFHNKQSVSRTNNFSKVIWVENLQGLEPHTRVLTAPNNLRV